MGPPKKKKNRHMRVYETLPNVCVCNFRTAGYILKIGSVRGVNDVGIKEKKIIVL